jgi:hypothetical protein
LETETQGACRKGNRYGVQERRTYGKENPEEEEQVAAVVCRRRCKHVLSWAMQLILRTGAEHGRRKKQYEGKGTETGR